MDRARHRSGVESEGRERAVSDVLAFILVFATILGSVAMLSAVGFQTMTDFQQGEQHRNADRAMESFADNVNDILRYGGVTERYGELSLRGGTVRTGTDGTTLNISIDGEYINDSGTLDLNTSDSDELDLGRFEYEADSETIAYEGGGVVRGEDNGGSVFLERPQLKCNKDSNRAVISLVTIDTADRGVQSDGLVGFRMTSVNRETIVEEGVNTVSISVTDSDYNTGWETMFERTDDWDDDGTCDPDDDMPVVITIVEANITY